MIVQIVYGQNCENTSAKKKTRNKDKGGKSLKEPTFRLKSQLVMLAQKVRKNKLFETTMMTIGNSKVKPSISISLIHRCPQLPTFEGSAGDK